MTQLLGWQLFAKKFLLLSAGMPMLLGPEYGLNFAIYFAMSPQYKPISLPKTFGSFARFEPGEEYRASEN
jgi:hypothetical protein